MCLQFFNETHVGSSRKAIPFLWPLPGLSHSFPKGIQNLCSAYLSSINICSQERNEWPVISTEQEFAMWWCLSLKELSVIVEHEASPTATPMNTKGII